jgi:hypothetical protein
MSFFLILKMLTPSFLAIQLKIWQKPNLFSEFPEKKPLGLVGDF